MLLSVAILQGYQEAITSKVLSFDAHIHLKSYQSSEQTEPRPIAVTGELISRLKGHKQVQHWQPYGLKPALLKTDDAVQGILIKGYDSQWDSSAFAINKVAGRFPKLLTPNDLSLQPDSEGTELMVSQKIANLMNLQLGQDVLLYFLQNPPRYRKLTLVGIYETSLEEFDTEIVIADLSMLRQLGNWGDTLVSGMELRLHNPDMAEQVAQDLQSQLSFELQALPITSIHPQVFDWLLLIARNVEILIVLVTIVACFNMCATLLILILERTRLVGLLKAMGASGNQLVQVFFLTGVRLVLQGMLYGNVLGLGLAWLQYQFHLIPLDPVNYYVAHVPIAWNWVGILVVNGVVLTASAIALWLPGLTVLRLSIVKALRFA